MVGSTSAADCVCLPSFVPAADSQDGCVCPKGSFLDGSSCTPCPNGEYQDTPAQSVCKTCGANQDTGGRLGSNSFVNCTCLPGFVFANNNQSSCVCPPGSYDVGGACQPCESGSYQDEAGKLLCKPCGVNRDTFGLTGRVSEADCVCSPLYYADQTSGSCKLCPVGMSCPGNNAIIIQPGFWRASEQTARVVSCSTTSCNSDSAKGLDDDADTGNTGTGLSRCVGSNQSVSLCANGYTGPLCSVCDEGYAQAGSTIDPSQVKCIICPPNGANIVLLIVLISLAGLLAYGLISSASVKVDNDGALESKTEQQRQGSFAVVIKVLLNYLQVLYYLGRLASNWSDLAQRFFNTVGIIGAMSPSNYSVQCAVSWRFYDSLVFVYVAPAIVVSILAVVYILRSSVLRVSASQCLNEFQLAAMVLLYQIHPTIMLEVISSFPCESVAGTGAAFLRRDMSVDCGSSEYALYATISAFYLVFYTGGMIAMTGIRMRTHKRNGIFSSASNPIYRKYAFFFVGYKDDAYFWEGVIMTRKLAIVAFSVLAAPMLQLVFGSLIIGLAFALNLHFSPFNSPFINRLEAIALIALYLTIVLGFIFLHICNRSNTDGVAAMLIIVNGSVIAVLVGSAIIRLKEVYYKIALIMPSWVINDMTKSKIRLSTRSSKADTGAEMTTL